VNISVRLEGGAGDCLLGNRFIPAIKEMYPRSDITAYIDSEGKTFQKELLEITYPYFYKEIKIIQRKKYKPFMVDCQFGTDNYYGALENVPDDIVAEMNGYDLFYDLHIDSLKWMTYDFDWQRYFKFFPRPQRINKKTTKKIVLHLVSSTSTGHRLEQWYLDGLINKICDKFPDHTVVAISTEETKSCYSSITNKNFVVHIGDIASVVDQIASADMMLSTDSGFRYLAYGFSIPTLTFSAHCPQPHTAIPSHMIRWLVFPETCYPLHYNMQLVVDTMNNINKNPGVILAPFITDFDQQMVRRIYTINKEKSILNL
jgi:ADP-heptose:LPS heptosyltransferase